jgi:hypothetical protein
MFLPRHAAACVLFCRRVMRRCCSNVMLVDQYNLNTNLFETLEDYFCLVAGNFSMYTVAIVDPSAVVLILSHIGWYA